MLDYAKNHASAEDQKKFLAGNQYFKDMTRMQTEGEKFNAGLGFIYTKNTSQYNFKQALTFMYLEGVEVVFPKPVLKD